MVEQDWMAIYILILPHVLSLSGSGDWTLRGWGKKNSHKLEAKCSYISWIIKSHFWQPPGEYKLNKAVDRNFSEPWLGMRSKADRFKSWWRISVPGFVLTCITVVFSLNSQWPEEGNTHHSQCSGKNWHSKSCLLLQAHCLFFLKHILSAN